MYVSGETRALSLRLVSEIVSVYLNEEQMGSQQTLKHEPHSPCTKHLLTIVTDTVLPL